MLVKLGDREAWIEDVSNHDSAVQPLHHPTQDGRLTGSYFTRHHHQPFATLNSVVQVGHHFRVRWREVDEAWIGSQREWQFFEPVKFCVHFRFLQLVRPPASAGGCSNAV